MESKNNKNKRRAFPYEIKPVDSEINEQLLKDFTDEQVSYVQVGPKKWLLPNKFIEEAENYYNFESRSDDVWVVTFPRSGTTRTQELVWLIANNFDYETAKNEKLTKRFPFLELSMCIPDVLTQLLLGENSDDPAIKAYIEEFAKLGYDYLIKIKSPRFIKTHFPFSLLPPSVKENNSKVIYVARNPKDVAVSLYHLNRLFRIPDENFDFSKFWDYFEKNLSYWMPYWEHIKEGWSHRNDPNVLFMFYEDMNNNIPEAIRKVAKFLDKPITEGQIKELTNYLTIENFRTNKSVNLSELTDIGAIIKTEEDFIRKGKTGCVNEFTKFPELNERADRWIEAQLKETDLRFPSFKHKL